jgi:cytochrome c
MSTIPGKPIRWRGLSLRSAGICAAVVAVAGALFLLVDQRVQAQSVQRGQTVYAAQCMACHSLDDNRTGPRHRDVLNRRAGSVPGFDYSPALRNSHLVWTPEHLLAWLKDPEALIPGQAMDFQLEQARDREDVVAYLASVKVPGP